MVSRTHKLSCIEYDTLGVTGFKNSTFKYLYVIFKPVSTFPSATLCKRDNIE